MKSCCPVNLVLKPFRFAPILAVLALLVGHAQVATAQSDQNWIPGNLNNDWSLGALNWDAGVGWTNGNNAIFGGTGETVELASDVQVNHITFNSNGYTIADANNDSVLTLNPASIITVTTSTHTATISEAIASGGITKAGNGTLALSGNNAFSGAVTINAGRLLVSHNSALGNTTGSTSIASGAQLTLADGVIITGESLTLAGSGISFTGALNVAADASATWAGAVNIVSGGRFGTEVGGHLTVSGPISGSNLVLSAFGTGVDAGVLVVSGTSNTYSGQTQIIRGILRLGASNALPTTTVLDVDSANSPTEASVFDLAGFNQTVGQLTRSANSDGGSFITNSGSVASTLTVNQSTTSVYSGILQDGSAALNFTKSGSGTLTLSGNNTQSGTLTVSTGTLILSGNNTSTGEVVVSGGVLEVAHNNAFGSTTTGSSVTSGRIVLQNSIKVTGEALAIAGDGGNSNGALQTATGAEAEWTGNIVVNSAGARLGGGVGGKLILSGVISGAAGGAVFFNRANDSTTVLNAVNTYTGPTQLFASGGTVGSRLVVGVDNAINAASRLTVLSSSSPAASMPMLLDLFGHVLTLSGLDSSNNHTNGTLLNVTNDGTQASTLTISSASTYTYSGAITNGTSVTHFAKDGSGTQILIGASSYTGETTVRAGTLQIGGSTGTLGSNGRLSGTSQINLIGGTLSLNNLGASNNATDRLANTTVVSLQGGALSFLGSDQTTTNSTETLGTVRFDQQVSTLTLTYGSTNTATLTTTTLQRAANGGIALVRGIALGKDSSSTASISRLLVTNAPTLVGTTAATNTGISTAKNTQIVPFLLGAVTSTTGGVGTAGTANTFVTYNVDTGLRPLNLTDEFTLNAFTSGHNTRITSTSTVGSTTAINSLILESADVSIASGQVLSVSSGAILITGSGGRAISGGTLAFGSQEGIITSYTSGNTSLSSAITGTAGLSLFGTSLFVINQQNSYAGNTAIYASVVPQSSSVGSPNAPTSGPFGTGTLILAGGSIRASSGGSVTIHNAVAFQADTTIPTGSTDKTLTFTGNVTLTSATRTLTQQNTTARTILSGAINDGGNGYGVILNGAGEVEFRGTNTYTGTTSVTAGTLYINGNQTTATGSVTVSGGTLGGTGTVGGTTVIAAGGTLSPGDPTSAGGLARLNIAQSLTLKTSSVTRLEITGATFTSLDSFGGNAPGSSGYINYVLSHATGMGNHDQLSLTGSITQENGGKIQVVPAGFTAVEGQIFNLLDWTAVSGNTFSSNLGDTYHDGTADSAYDLDLPSLGSGLVWDTSFFASHGVLVVVALVPEPSRAMLMFLALAFVNLRRRRLSV
ncbi:PEP-CTERM protein-sorting domain-containing protein [Prosthecobacter debontii]|uniref:PEP-CTERM protein-sorting domain-containing protein n=1 Tax=Prosthecobacter debontii TaxID=48467 RepID=A0A1T4XG26_9BACT|nr:autotransporter-associated beta strand repeat-containing protein [Prosthecobacter debontii]SKA88532.1 PEP-CTERM protein-sorting domain-containing protein [Prosthecobacter debontii]